MRLKNLISLLVLAVVLIVIPGTCSVYAASEWEDLDESNDLNTGKKYQDIYGDAVNGRWSFQTINTS